jgi:hypothetical protein
MNLFDVKSSRCIHPPGEAPIMSLRIGDFTIDSEFMVSTRRANYRVDAFLLRSAVPVSQWKQTIPAWPRPLVARKFTSRRKGG